MTTAFTTIWDEGRKMDVRCDNLPEYVDDNAISMTANARTVLEKRYLRKGSDGKPIETIAGMFYRIASVVAQAEKPEEREDWTHRFYDLMSSFDFLPNTPTFTGAGTPLGQIAACFVLPVEDDMGRSPDGIFSTLRNAALIQQTGGGVGFSFSRLRPKGGRVSRSNGQATGPVDFMRVYDKAFGVIAQGGCLSPDTLVFTSDGLLRLDEIADVANVGWREHNVEVPTDQGMRRSPRSFNNGVADVIKITTRDGLEVIGTPNHKFKVMTSSGPQWKRIDQIKSGDNLLVSLNQHSGKIRALAQPVTSHHNEKNIGLPLVLDDAFAFVLGYMTGNGFVASGENDHRVGFSVPNKSYLINDLPLIIEQLFPGCKIRVQAKPNDESVTFVIDSSLLKKFLEINGLSKSKSTDATVPALIRKSPRDIAGAYLRGLFEADGAVSHGYPSLSTSSRRLASEVQTLLIGLGCPTSVSDISASTERYGSAKMWQVRISSSVGLDAWRSNIGCDESSRFMVCVEHIPDKSKESSYVLPCASWWLSSILESITLPQIDRQGRGEGKNFRSSNPSLRKSLLRYVRGDRNLTLSAYAGIVKENFLHDVAPNTDNLWYSEVSVVEDYGERLTLDIEVEQNHTYLAYGIVTHNSRRGANMGVLRVDHPDIQDFIIAKATEGDVANFNISVGITDVFMDAVKDDKEYAIIDPHTGATVRYEKAREIFDLIADCAHRNGEPGLLFLDRANRANPVPNLYTLEATNPCVTGDTLIRTKEGRFRADELYEIGNPLMVEVSPAFGVDRWQHVSHVFCTGEKMVYSLETVAGHYLKATSNHKIMTARGWVEMSDLESDDLIQVVSNEWESSFVGIERIEEIGIEKVYDLTEPVTHSFIANGIVAHNCGEQWLGPYENCCLGSINLANHVRVIDGVNDIDWLKLTLTTQAATRFLDNVVTVNKYVPDVPQLKQAAQATRRIGLGIMGLADALYMLNLSYDSRDGVDVASVMMEHIHFCAMQKSVDLASVRGSFDAIKGSIFDPEDFKWIPPEPLVGNRGEQEHARWLGLIDQIKQYGIRNSTVTTIAPTGTISTVAGLEGYGCEPVFALGYIRHFKDGDKDVELSYVSPIFQKAIQDADITNEKRKYLIDYAAHHGTLRGANINGVPENIVKTFVTSGDIDHLSHIEMQSALQRFVSNSISKTINMPEDSTVDDVAKAYQVAYIYGCNGITVYRTGSRNQVVLETASTKNKKQDTEQTLIPTKRQRPAQMRGSTIRKETPTGRAYVTVNEDNGQPFEVFVNVGKAGSEITAVSEAIGRLISMILRMPAQMAQLERLKWVAEELGGIGGSRPFGFGAKRVLSLADGIAQALREYIGGEPVSEEMAATPIEKSKPVGDICPDCGEATLLHVEGCNKCANCGYSAC